MPDDMHFLLPRLRQNLPNLHSQLSGTLFHASGKRDVGRVDVIPVSLQIGGDALEIMEPVKCQTEIPQDFRFP